MQLNQAPPKVRTLAACLWVVPAILLSYLFQNRVESFFLEIIYPSFFLCNFICFADFDLPDSPYLKISPILPCAINSYYFFRLIQPGFSVPSLRSVLSFLLFLPGILLGILFGSVTIIPMFAYPVVLVSKFLMFLADLIHTFWGRLDSSVKLCTIIAVASFFFIACFSLPAGFSIHPLPEIVPSSQSLSVSAPKRSSGGDSSPAAALPFDSDEVWIPTHGGKKYHRCSTCSGMVDPELVTKEYAIDHGFDACQKCY